MPARSDRTLWQCPRCGAEFVNRKQWHSCGEATLEDWLRDLGRKGRALFDAFEPMIARCGDYRVAPAKSRIAFMGLVRFAGITRLGDDGMTCAFSLPYPLESGRFRRVREEVPGWFIHELRVMDPTELDADVDAWVRESHRLMGMRERLGSD